MDDEVLCTEYRNASSTAKATEKWEREEERKLGDKAPSLAVPGSRYGAVVLILTEREIHLSPGLHEIGPITACWCLEGDICVRKASMNKVRRQLNWTCV